MKNVQVINDLSQLGVTVTIHADGAHLKLEYNGVIAEYWPDTERWKGKVEEGYHYKYLLSYLGVQ